MAGVSIERLRNFLDSRIPFNAGMLWSTWRQQPTSAANEAASPDRSHRCVTKSLPFQEEISTIGDGGIVINDNDWSSRSNHGVPEDPALSDAAPDLKRSKVAKAPANDMVDISDVADASILRDLVDRGTNMLDPGR